ncbi:MAG: mechanosensitive ion channel [Ignavibacteriaceae bacterium]|nr:mechanosensitive ion channel family protein [Ignavibacteriaceae bacterium]NUM71249.1 mechanosensitive ion channel [Ignavibacteriaceae bacterium]
MKKVILYSVVFLIFQLNLTAQITVTDSLIKAKKITVLGDKTKILENATPSDTIYVLTDTVRIKDTVIIEKQLFIPDSLLKNTKAEDSSSVFLSPISIPDKLLKDTDEIVSKFSIWTLIGIILIALLTILFVRVTEKLRDKVYQKYESRFFGITFGVLKGIIVFLGIYYSSLILFYGREDKLFLFLGIITLITGLAAIPMVKNLIGKFYILSGATLVAGDFIKLGDIKGRIKRIGWRYTTLESDTGVVSNIPNSVFLDTSFDNLNLGRKEEFLAFEFDFPIKLPVEQMLKILREAALSNQYLYTRKEPEVFLHSFDLVNNLYKFKVKLYLFDSNYEDELIDTFNRTVLKSVREATESEEGRVKA